MKAHELSRVMNADLVSFIGTQQQRDIQTVQEIQLLRQHLFNLMNVVNTMQRECLPASDRIDVVQKMRDLFGIVQRALPGELASPKKGMPLARLETLSRETYEFTIKYSSALTALHNMRRNLQNATLPLRTFIHACETAMEKMDEAQRAIDDAAQRVIDGDIPEVPEETRKKYANAVLEMQGGSMATPAVLRLTQNSIDGILSRRIAMAPAYITHIEHSLTDRLSFDKVGGFEGRRQTTKAIEDLSPDDDVLMIEGMILVLKEFTSNFAKIFLPAGATQKLLAQFPKARTRYESLDAVFLMLKRTTRHLVLDDFQQLMSRFSWIPVDQRRTCIVALHAHLERSTDVLFNESEHLSGLGTQDRHIVHALSMEYLQWIMEHLATSPTTERHPRTKEDIPA